MKKILFYLFLFIAPTICYSASPTSIAAIVGEDIISTIDVYNRINLTMTTAGVEKTQENADRLLPQVLQQLIDEILIEKEARNLKLDVSKHEIDEVIHELEGQNKIQAGGFEGFLKNSNIAIEVAIKQIKSQLLWSKIVGYKIRPKLNVSENEIEEALGTSTPEYTEVSFKQIFLALDNLNDAEIKDKITELSKIREMVKDCNDMEIVANKMHPKVSVDLITLPIKKIHPDLQNMVKNLPIGKASKVIKSSSGLRIITVCKRDFIGLTNHNREEIRNMIMQRKLALQANHYISELRKKSFIEVYI